MSDEFKTHLLNDAGIQAATAIGNIFGEALEKLERIVPAGRERALVVTNLQQACFWAKRGIAILPENQRSLPDETELASSGLDSALDLEQVERLIRKFLRRRKTASISGILSVVGGINISGDARKKIAELLEKMRLDGRLEPRGFVAGVGVYGLNDMYDGAHQDGP